MSQTTDARGVTVTRTIDELDRVTLADYPGTDLDVGYTYDAPLVPFSKGRLTAITRDGESVDYAYDRFGRLTLDGELGYGYDQNGNRTSVEYPGGVTAVSTFDYADRPESLTVQRPGDPDLPIASGATYEPAGPLSHLDLGNGLSETRPYTNRYFPSAITVEPTTPLAGAPVLQWTYGTDNVGNILSIDDSLTPANDKTYGYQDFQYFLTGGTGPWGTLAWTYDQIGNRLTETRDGVTDTYAYTSNGTGNTALLSTVTLGLGGTRGYTYGPAGHLEQVVAPGNQITFLSDAAGRLTRLERPAGDARSDLLYDGRSFLRWAEASSYSNLFADGFETGDGSCWTLSEGSDINAGTATCARGPQLDSVYSSDGLLHAVTHRPLSGPESTHFYLYLAGRPVAQLDIDAAGIAIPTWLTTDHLGTPVLATDAAGSVLWQGGFEPFGADYSGAEAAGVDLRFPGQWVDGTWEDAGEGAGVVYNVHRWNEIGADRYSRPDPLGLRGGLELFLYAKANPIFFVDPFGLVVERCCRNIEVNQFVDTTSRAFGLQHCFIKTDSVEAGMGPADAGPLPACPFGVETAVVDHSGQSRQPGTTCKVITDVDEECVNGLLGLGRPTGRWSPVNQCNSFANGVFEQCRNTCQQAQPSALTCGYWGCVSPNGKPL